MAHNALLNWGRRANDRYEPDFQIGSEDDDGSHLRDADAGWPYSIYLKAAQIGVSDICLATGIQHRADADALCALVNALPRT
jgi:hypothetical protein